MQFTWDEAKRLENLRIHGLDFADAECVFAGEVFRREDARYAYDEQRMIAISLLDAVTVLIVQVEDEKTIHIISMRRADKHETKIHFDYVTSV